MVGVGRYFFIELTLTQDLILQFVNQKLVLVTCSVIHAFEKKTFLFLKPVDKLKDPCSFMMILAYGCIKLSEQWYVCPGIPPSV